MGHELELKLEIDPGSAAKFQSLELLQGTPRIERLISTYFDTPKGKLLKSGWVLRLRRHGDGWTQTLKRTSAGAGVFDREEWETAVNGPEPDLRAARANPLGKDIGPHRARSLAPLFQSDVERTSWTLRSNGAEIELSLDEGEVLAGSLSAPVHEIELELTSGEPGELFVVAAEIARQLPVRLAVQSKSERGHQLVAEKGHKPAAPTGVTLGPDATVEGGLRAIVFACLKQFRLNEPRLVDDRDAEALHQLRVAVRRLRTALWLFKPAAKGPEHARLSDTLRSLTRELGAARNIDVILSALPLGDPARSQLERDRRKLYSRIVRKLGSRKFQIQLLDLLGWSQCGEWRGHGKARRLLLPFAVKRLDHLWDRIIDRSDDLQRMSAAQRHRLRIDAKNIRYALGFLTELLADVRKSQVAFGKAAEGLQDSLGMLNDLATRSLLLASFREPPASLSAHYLHDARRSLRKMRKIGPYWRTAGN